MILNWDLAGVQYSIDSHSLSIPRSYSIYLEKLKHKVSQKRSCHYLVDMIIIIAAVLICVSHITYGESTVLFYKYEYHIPRFLSNASIHKIESREIKQEEGRSR